MYLTLLTSYVRWLESQGKPPTSARQIAALAASAAALANTLAVVMVIQAAGGPRLLEWYSKHAWVVFPAAVVIGAIHWLLCSRIPLGDLRSPRLASRVWWTSYMAGTLLLWILGAALTLVLVTTGRTCLWPGGRCGI